MAVGAKDAQSAWVPWLLGRPGIALAFLWGLAEGTLFFVIPDVLLSFAAMFQPRRALRHVAAATGGAVLAGAILFSWGAASPERALSAVLTVPFVRTAMFEKVDADYEHLGIKSVFKGPALGIPYKIYAVEAPKYVAVLPFLLASVPARAWRFLLVWLIFAAGGVVLRKMMPDRPKILASIHAMVWIAFYTYYWTTI